MDPASGDELYKRKKHPFLAPTQWPKDGPLHRKFKGLLTQEAVDGLGFVDPEAIQKAMENAWARQQTREHSDSYFIVVLG
ncbi:hypothetical protein N7453_008830 [Penicillium expansum]|nr:hypothetical protein N7453_008830 [Penicillium expansum]